MELVVVLTIAALTTALVIPTAKKMHMSPREHLRFVVQDARATCMAKGENKCLLQAREGVLILPWDRGIKIEGLIAGKCEIMPTGAVSNCAFLLEDKILRFSEFDL